MVLEDRGAFVVTASSLTMEMMAVTRAIALLKTLTFFSSFSFLTMQI
jgi:hypothetical protein